MNYENLLNKLGFKSHPVETEYKIFEKEDLKLVVKTDLTYMEIYKSGRLDHTRNTQTQVMIGLEKYL